MTINKKILILAILTIGFIFAFNFSNVKATFDFTYNGENYSLPDLPFDTKEHPDFILLKYNDENGLNGHYWVVGFPYYDYELPFIKNNNDGFGYHIKGTSNWGHWNVSQIYKDSWTSVNLYGNDYELYTTGKYANSTAKNVSSIAYSTSDVYTEEGDLFFQGPVARGKVLARLLDKEEMEKTTLQIRSILPMILVVVVSFLGLRKALKMLSTILHRS